MEQMNERSPINAVIVFTALIVFVFTPASMLAANHYIRAGATGNGSGSDWTNACPGFVGSCSGSSMVRGDTYYVASGSYGSETFNTPTDGSKLIIVKKATASDYGTATGWNSSYSNSAAVFVSLSFASQYWILDGVSRASDTSGYGIQIVTGPAVNPSNKGITLNGSGNVTIRFVDIAGHGPDGQGGGNDMIYASSAVSNITIQYCYLHDAGRTLLLSRGGSGWLLEHSVVARNESTSTEHAEAWSLGNTSDTIVRYNRFEGTMGTAILGNVTSTDPATNWDIYGNVFLNCSSNNGAITTSSGDAWSKSRVYNNTFIGGVGYNQGVTPDVGADDWQVYNNIWYDNAHVSFNTPHDYNWFNSSGSQTETNIQNGSGNPFVSLSAGDFHLSTATKAGFTLSSSLPQGCAAGTNCYNIDPDGVRRGADGTWDRGAYDFKSGNASLPQAPSGLAAMVVTN